MGPKISVIIPFYNVERYIAPCLDSVLSQSYKNIEVLCVDDHGQDGSRAIVDEYAAKDDRVKVLSYGENRGLGPARNFGMESMTGEYFFFLDSDDLLTENALQHLYEIIARTKADMVIAPMKAFADEDRPDLHRSVASLNPTFELMTDYEMQVDEHNYQRMLDASYAVACGKLFSTEYMRRKGIRFYEKRVFHEDKGFWLKCVGSLPYLASTSEVAYLYRIRGGSILTTATKEQRKLRKEGIRIAVKDGVKHLYAMHDKERADRLYELTRSHRSFAPQLDPLYLGGLLRFRWFKHEKLVELCRVQIYREKVRRDGVKEYRLFGLLLHSDKNPS